MRIRAPACNHSEVSVDSGPVPGGLGGTKDPFLPIPVYQKTRAGGSL
jgi:hypothetical protein